MFKSLKSFANIPVQIKPFDKHTGTGSKVFKTTVSGGQSSINY